MIALALAVLAASGPAGDAPNCGVTSVAALLTVLDRRPDQALRERLRAASAGDMVTMEQVIALATRHGVASAGYQATLDELAELGRPAILHLAEPDHFVCLIGLDAEWAQVFDGWPTSFRILARAALSARYTGQCVLPDAPEAGPRANLAQRHQQFRTGEAGHSVGHRYVLRNRGNEVLTVRPGGSSCTCTTGLKGVLTVAPGEQIEIPVELELTPGRGALEYLKLALNDPRCPLVFLSLGVDQVPQNITWQPAEVVLAGLPLEAPPARFRLVGPPGFRFVAWSEPDLADVRVVEHQTRADKELYVLEVRAFGERTTGRHDGRILIDPRQEGVAPFAVPVSWLVPEVLRPAPRRVADLRLQPGPYRRGFTFERLVRLPIAITAAEVEGLPLEVGGIGLDEVGRWRVELTGDLTPGIHRGRLLVRTDSRVQPELSVPITLEIVAP